jgi:hypothetical protein
MLMDSQKVHQAGCVCSAHPGVGVEPGGFTPPGGGGEAIPRLVKWLVETFYEVIYSFPMPATPLFPLPEPGIWSDGQRGHAHQS